MPYRVVNTDNFGRDYPNETFAADDLDTRAEAQACADKLNGPNSCYSSRYYKVEELPYELEPGFEP